MLTSLPIWQIHSDIVGALTAGNRLVLVAPTGSGKTTQVPQMLLDAGLAGPRKIVVLQPRRVAARTVAARVAWERNVKLGAEVGYQIRFDDQTSLGTRICFVTEGILLRWLQDDRTLPDIGVILFDEFHERNLLSDVALALVKQLQATQRPDLKLAVMSATLEAEPVADYLGGATTMQAERTPSPSSRLAGPEGENSPELKSRVAPMNPTEQQAAPPSPPREWERGPGRGGSFDRSGPDLGEGRAEEAVNVSPLPNPLPTPFVAGRGNQRPVSSGATLNAPDVTARAPDAGTPCPILISEGQSFPVEVRHLDSHDERPITEQAADAVERIVNSGEPGDILVFMPGMGEINATINACRAAQTQERLAFIPLHGELPPEDQDLAFAPNPLRKVVVATNVAETSVTIDGIRHVVDSGLARIARYDSERGIGTLFIEEISRASADQRKGRAGRTAPGTCHRLWTASGHLNRPERNTPEIQRSDLAEVVLLLHSLHIRKAAQFDWLDKPDPAAVERAEDLLRLLGALDATTDELTPIGRQMQRLPMHPRYSRMLIEAARFGCVQAAALCAALVSGRDLLQRLRREDKHIAEARELFEASQDSDFFTLMRAWQFARKNNFNVETCRRHGIHAQSARQVEQTHQQIVELARQQRLLKPDEKVDDSQLLRCIMLGFIDQLCLRRDTGTLECDLAGGRSGTLVRESVVQNSPLFVAASIRDVPGRHGEPLTLLGLASAVKREWVAETGLVQSRVEYLYDRTHKRVAAVRLDRFQGLVIHHEHQRDIDPAASGRCLAEAARKGYFELPLFNHELKQFIARVNLVCEVMPELDFPPLDEPDIINCLARAFASLTLAKEAQATHLREAFLAHLAKEQVAWLDELTPTTISWPGGHRHKLQYASEGAPSGHRPGPPELQVKLTDCFALQEHPRVCEGKMPVRLWLCTPDGKRLESTSDWPAFRTGGYLKLKPALQKKYPGTVWV